MDHFNQPRNIGEMPDADMVGDAVNPACMDHLRLWLRVDGDTVLQAVFQCEGCVPSIAAGSLMTEYVKGQTVEELRRLDAEAFEQLLGGLPPTKKHAAHLAIDALQTALQRGAAAKQLP